MTDLRGGADSGETIGQLGRLFPDIPLLAFVGTPPQAEASRATTDSSGVSRGKAVLAGSDD
ncbi:MAG: hypothetical protein JSV80_13100 [Acidobacteriota bacterium]|nr:MAG: hypothetical protein JSV80_13100 [Acidobacteriota bacterium]